MVVIPLKEYPVETTKPVQPGVSPSEVAQPYRELANTLQEFGDAADTTAKSLAEQAGAQAVTRDANGDIQVQKAAFIGPAAQVYEHQVKIAALAEADGKAQREDIKLRTQFRDDPQGYLTAADEFARTTQSALTKAAGPEVGNAVRRVVERTTTQTYRGLLSEKENLDLNRTSAVMKVGIEQASDDLNALARNGITDPNNPDVKAALDKWNTLTDQRTNNPRLAYPKEQADFDRDQLLNGMAGNAYVYAVNQTYKNAPTKEQGAKDALEKAQEIYDPKYHLSQQQRESLFHKASAEIRANEAVRKNDISELHAAWREIQVSSANGGRIDSDVITQFREQFKALGSPAGVAMVDSVASHMPLHDSFSQGTIADQTAQVMAIRRASPYAKTLSDSAQQYGLDLPMFARQINQESGFNPNVVSPAGATGIAQFMPATAARYGVDPRNPESAIPGAAHYMSDLTKMFGGNSGLALAGYNWGEGNVQKWLAAGADPSKMPAETRNYVQSITGRPISDWMKSDFASRPPAKSLESEGPGVASWLLANRASELNDNATKAWKQMVADWDGGKGQTPTDKSMYELLDAARAANNIDLQAKITNQITAIHKVNEISQLPLDQQHATEVYWREQLAKGEAPQGGELVRKLLEQRTAAITEGLKENPISTAVSTFPDRYKTPGPLNTQDLGQLTAGLAYRGKIAQFLGQNYKAGTPAALDKADVASLSAALQSPDPAVKGAIFQAISAALPEDVRNATLAKLGEQGGQQRVAIAAGALMQQAPEVAKSILRGQQAIAADKGYLPTQGSEHQDFTAYLAEKLPPATFSLADRTSESGAMATATGAIKARYADLSAQAADAGGKLIKDRLAQAVTDITGGVLNHNGGTLIAPQRGMPQQVFDNVLWGVTDADLGHGPMPSNLGAADRALNLTPQERALYQRHLTNLTGSGGVTNPDGSRSTLFQMSFERDGKTYNVPTVWNGQILKPDEAIKRAEAEGLDKFPSYSSEAEAEARYGKMHDFMERDTAAYLKGGANPQAVTTLSGEPVTAAYLRGNAQLESVASGRYLVRLGKREDQPIYAYQGANTEAPQKFILDLRGRQQGKIPSVDTNKLPANIP